MVQGRYVFPFSQLRMTDVDRVGGKNASLGELLSQLTSAGIRVPDGFATTVSNFASGTGRWSWSDVLMSATSLNMDISSGRLKNLANLVLAR